MSSTFKSRSVKSRAKNPRRSLKKKKKESVAKKTEIPIKLIIKFYNTDLSAAENALFMFYEAFHDLIHDSRGKQEDIKNIKMILEPVLRKQANILSRTPFDFNMGPLNEKMNRIHHEVLERLAKGSYNNFEKLLLMRIIDFCGEHPEQSGIKIKPISAYQTEPINFVYHDAGFEDKYTSSVTTVNSSFCRLDKWTQHPNQDEIDKENKEMIVNFAAIPGREFVGKIFEEGTVLRFGFDYFNFVRNKPILTKLQMAVKIVDFRDKGNPVFEFTMIYSGEAKLTPFPVDNVRKHCYSVADAKSHLANIFRNSKCIDGLTLCPEIIKVMAMKAVGDKVTFIEAKLEGTVDSGAQAAAVTHDKLSQAYLVRDLDERLKKNRDFLLKSNLVIPVYREDVGMGTRKGIIFSNKRMVILHAPNAESTFNLTRKDVEEAYRYEQMRAEARAYQMGFNNALGLSEFSEADREKIMDAWKSRSKKSVKPRSRTVSKSRTSMSLRPRKSVSLRRQTSIYGPGKLKSKKKKKSNLKLNAKKKNKSKKRQKNKNRHKNKK